MGSGAMLKRASASFPPIVPPSFSRIARRNAHTTQYRAACARIWAMTERRWLRVPQAAVYANMGVGLIRKLIRQRHLRAIDVGRYYVIDRLDLDACLQELKSTTGPQPIPDPRNATLRNGVT